MSATYTLHLPEHAIPGDPEALERSTVVRDGFSWWAFVAPMLWLFWHRHWVLGILAGLVVGLVGLGLSALGLRTGAILGVEILLHLLFGFEAASLRRFVYERRGRPVGDVVTAVDAADAEAKSFARWLAPRESLAPREANSSRSLANSRTNSPSYASSSEPIIGLFPDREGR